VTQVEECLWFVRITFVVALAAVEVKCSFLDDKVNHVREASQVHLINELFLVDGGRTSFGK